MQESACRPALAAWAAAGCGCRGGGIRLPVAPLHLFVEPLEEILGHRLRHAVDQALAHLRDLAAHLRLTVYASSQPVPCGVSLTSRALAEAGRAALPVESQV